MESLEQPLGDRILHAMARAFPDAVDVGLLSMVLGSEPTRVQAGMTGLVHRGLACARGDRDGDPPRWDVACITDKGMLVADGLASDEREAAALLDRLEAATLRQLLLQRIRGSRLNAQQAQDLRESLACLSDRWLVDAGPMWAHQTVSDWRALVRVMQVGGSAGGSVPATG